MSPTSYRTAPPRDELVIDRGSGCQCAPAAERSAAAAAAAGPAARAGRPDRLDRRSPPRHVRLPSIANALSGLLDPFAKAVKPGAALGCEVELLAADRHLGLTVRLSEGEPNRPVRRRRCVPVQAFADRTN